MEKRWYLQNTHRLFLPGGGENYQTGEGAGFDAQGMPALVYQENENSGSESLVYQGKGGMIGGNTK